MRRGEVAYAAAVVAAVLVAAAVGAVGGGGDGGGCAQAYRRELPTRASGQCVSLIIMTTS